MDTSAVTVDIHMAVSRLLVSIIFKRGGPQRKHGFSSLIKLVLFCFLPALSTDRDTFARCVRFSYCLTQLGIGRGVNHHFRQSIVPGLMVVGVEFTISCFSFQKHVLLIVWFHGFVMTTFDYPLAIDLLEGSNASTRLDNYEVWAWSLEASSTHLQLQMGKKGHGRQTCFSVSFWGMESDFNLNSKVWYGARCFWTWARSVFFVGSSSGHRTNEKLPYIYIYI